MTRKIHDLPPCIMVPCLMTGKRTCKYGNLCQCSNCLINRETRRVHFRLKQRLLKGQVNAAHRKRAERLKRKVFDHYGWRCVCCGITISDFLTLDHVNGNGREDRRGQCMENMYLRIIHAAFPDTYRILCFNCNCSRGCYEYCPHERREK